MTDYRYHIYAPYRVCPLGAHVDHQHGIVTGFAFDMGVNLYFSPTDDGHVKLHSHPFGGKVEFCISDRTRIKEGDWGDYARGAKYALSKRFVLRRGIEGEVDGSLPVGGLSSSAAVLVVYIMALSFANDIMLTKMEVVKIASEAECEYIGLNNGILDQSCIVLGEKDSLLFIDTASEEYRVIPQSAKMPPFEIGIIFSGLTRTLVSSDYNLRVSECKAAAWNMLAFTDRPLKTLDKTFLRDISYETYQKTRDKLPVRFARRAEHFYTEYRRVRKGVTAWESGNMKLFGQLCRESCESSIHNYECGSPELIAIYEIMSSIDGVWGGRFSGAGFKGACMALVDPAKKESVRRQLTEEYLHRFPDYEETFEIHFCKTDNGARFLND